jgi:carbamoyltransferase
MIVLGISGGFDIVGQPKFITNPRMFHDSAAALVKDGHVIAAIEQERLDRVKHSNSFPSMSARFCLKRGGIQLSDLDYVAIYFREDFIDTWLGRTYLNEPAISPIYDARSYYQAIFKREFGINLRRDQFRFIEHHLAHATEGYKLSGFNDCLLLSIDGVGEEMSTVVIKIQNGIWEVLHTKRDQDSLGLFYLNVIRFLGYDLFDEYKIMGLAPYGNPEKFKEILDTCYSLLPNGDYSIHSERLRDLYKVLKPRRKGEEISQMHKDLSACLQQALEKIVLHVAEHYRYVSKQLVLCGGVAQNSSMTGRLLRSGLFSNIYIPPASGDSGCAVGAALATFETDLSSLSEQSTEGPFWGPAIDDLDVFNELTAWQGMVAFRKLDNTFAETAAIIAGGAVIGWVQGRSEFGPRALGNRSILADPRPFANRELINSMIKKRESFRPFAPSVIVERVKEFFEVPECDANFSCMTFVLPVRAEWRDVLQAVTHIDGTARLQTVSRQENARFWELLSEFSKLTTIPILLNTSFNNNCEPIVDSVEDALVCFMDSNLHYLVIGDYLVWRKAVESVDYRNMVPSLPLSVRISHQISAYEDSKDCRGSYFIQRVLNDKTRTYISEPMFDFSQMFDGYQSIQEIQFKCSQFEWNDQIRTEMEDLWSKRLIVLRPKALR